MLGVARDIIEQNRQETERRLLIQVVEETDDLVSLTGREGRPRFVNDAVARSLGVTADETVGRPVALIDWHRTFRAPGRGTTVTVRLPPEGPVPVSDQADAAAPAPVRPAGRRLRILVPEGPVPVDDASELAHLWHRTFRLAEG